MFTPLDNVALPAETQFVSDPAQNLADIRRSIEGATKEAGREADVVRLVAISKTFGHDAISPLLAAGQRDFGENRIQEAIAKWPELREINPDVRLHLVGSLQSNKVADAVALFDSIHTLDRDKIAAAIASEMAKQGRLLQLFVQVNTGG
ncbi:MAG: alanine racemase, partial [Alphaproteobacteria bacterium]